MCPGTITIASLAMAAGSLGGGLSSAGAAGYQAQVAKNNATIAEQNAGYSAEATSTNVENAGLQARSQTAGAKAAAAAGGLNVNTGSPAAVVEGQREAGAFEQATAASRGAEAVYGYTAQASSYKAQQKLDSAEVVPDIVGGLLGAGGSLGGSASQTDLSTLLSGGPAVPQQYSWMMGPSSAAQSNAYAGAGSDPIGSGFE